MRTRNLAKAKSKQIRVLYMATLVLFLPLFVGIYFLYLEDKKTPDIAQPDTVEEISVNLNSTSIDAYSAIVVSLNTQKIMYEKNAEKQLPLASLTKLVTAKVADDQISTKNVSIDKMTDSVEYGDPQLLEHEVWDKKNLIQYTLITSSNDGAHSLAQNSKSPHSFIQNMKEF